MQTTDDQTLERNSPTTGNKLTYRWYKLQGIFNVEKFGVFSQALPNKTVKLKNKKYTGGKYSKVRLTVISAASAVNGKVPLLVTKKARTLRCFKTQRKSWMKLEIFKDWVKQLDQKFVAQNCKVALIVDSFSAHMCVG